MVTTICNWMSHDTGFTKDMLPGCSSCA
jgi:hypothetical protein